MEFKETIENARKKLETPMAAAMPCKTSKKSKHGETRGKTSEFKSKLACILEASESTRMRMEDHYRITMRIILQEEGTIHYSITIWCANLFLCLKPWKFPQRQQQWIKNGRNLERFWCGTWRKSEVNPRWSMNQGRRAQKFILPHWWTCVICRIGGKAPKIQRSSCTPRRHCGRWFWILCSLHWTRIISISNDGSKGHGYHIQTARMRRTSSWRSICLHSGKFGRCSQLTENFQIGMSTCMDSSTTTQKFLWQDCYGKGNLRKSYWSMAGRKFQIGNAYSYTVKKGYSYLCMWMTSNWLKWNKILFRCGKYSTKKSIWENQHLSLIFYTWAALNDNVK